ncbi:MAG: DinB family protein [Deferribacteraceae bacterium]|jgi:hypothetical protein|nr:DinB family protein [Deferribacteraceae bacterium]
MSIDLKKEMYGAFPFVLASLKADINNCPEALWEKRCGGNPYWQQVFHAIVSTSQLLDSVEKPNFPIPIEVASLQGSEYISDYDGVHSKELMLESLDVLMTYIDRYFEALSDDDLAKTVDFYGSEMTLFNKIGIATSHIMYHIGALDAALRDNGGKASM